MKQAKTILVVTVLIVLALQLAGKPVKAQAVYHDGLGTELSAIFNGNDVLKLKKYLAEKILLVIDEREGFYSREQGFQVLKYFFKNKKITYFEVEQFFYYSHLQRVCMATFYLDTEEYNVQILLQVRNKCFFIQELNMKKYKSKKKIDDVY